MACTPEDNLASCDRDAEVSRRWLLSPVRAVRGTCQKKRSQRLLRVEWVVKQEITKKLDGW